MGVQGLGRTPGVLCGGRHLPRRKSIATETRSKGEKRGKGNIMVTEKGKNKAMGNFNI